MSLHDGTTQRPLGYWLKHIDGALEASMARLFAADSLTRRGWQVLNTVAQGPASLAGLDKALAPFLSADEPTVRPYVDDLAGRGWAHVTGDGTVTLTEEGRRAHERIAEQVGALRARVTESLSPEEYGMLVGLLQRVAAHLDAEEPRAD
ncbi:MarR family winged helix-turn-helix transcriptional regulator [Streptomyces roseicoloratus]|uniref:MarR family transcriptional regulator n=1 Tax=Streptomyces roseicoloratus TaxID=2508722 RepID=A0ABY9RS45_9ACTN|nr:MarR family transcriptional regulator [Streptomyces roseicoloratus]WMX44991.1 MarR family transcriptional regulator [Streptomyces roseicoloratus]